MNQTRQFTLRLIRAFVLVAVLAALLPAPTGHAQPNLAQPDGTTRLRIGVTTDGLTVLRPQDLAAAGIDPASVNPLTFALSSMGQPVAVRVTGEADGRFDPDDRLIFYGQRFRGPEMQQKYTDERVYWLDMGGAPGPRVLDIAAAPQGNLTPPADFPDTLHAEESLEWWSLDTLKLDTQDTWFWARLTAVTAPATANLSLFVPDPAPSAAATLRVEVVARGYNNNYAPDHRTTITLNGAPLLDESWDGKVRRVFQTNVPGGLLAAGANTAAVSALVPANLVVDDVYVNYLELDYRRLFRANAGRLSFTAESPGTHEYLTSGWPNDQVEVWDISTPASPRRLTGAAFQPGAGGLQARFRVEDGASSRSWLQTVETLNAPASVRLRPPTTLRAPAGGADVVIVTDESLLPAAQTLANWHISHGRRPIVALFRDVVDEFNDGIYHPRAVPAMLAWAQTHWEGASPRYLTLLGDGHWNFKGYNPAKYPPAPNLVPPYLAFVDPWQGEAPADALYGDTNGDGRSEYAVGRIPANTLAEANTVVGKIIAYDDSLRLARWQRRSIFVADNTDSNGPDYAGNFQALSDEIIRDDLPRDQYAERIYLNTPAIPNADAARQAIANAIQSGAFMLHYTGHGEITSWAHEQIWRTIDVAGLQNGGALPVVMTLNCLDGYFAYPGTPSMAETMLLRQGGGSIAAISATGRGLAPDQQNLRKLVMTELFRNDVPELGMALQLAKEQFYRQYGDNYVLATMTLYGDPAMRLPSGKEWTYLPHVLR